MATQFTLPALGENVPQGTLVKILVKEGESVVEDQPVLELETDKAVLEVPSTVSGTVGKILVEEGATIQVGQAIFEVGSAAGAESQTKSESAVEERVPTTEYATPQAEAGAQRDANPSQATTPTPAPQASAPQASAPQSTAVQSPPALTNGSSNGLSNGASNGNAPSGSGTDTPTNNGYVAPVAPAQNGSSNGGQNGASTPVAPGNAPQVQREPAAAAPSIRRMARELGVDIHDVQGSGMGGRISDDDVKRHARELVGKAAQPASQPQNGAAPQAPTPATIAAPLPDLSKFGPVERQPLSGIRRATSEQMNRAWTIPHVTQFDKADITDLEALRKQYAPRVEKSGGKLTVTAIILKVVAAALRAYPNFNSSLDLANGELVLKNYCHIGVAVDTERGLLVPVLRDVDRKSISELAKELGEIAQKARDRKLSLEEMQGGSFTITNLGGIGGTAFTPIINTPEVAILGLSRSVMEPVWKDDGCVGRLMMPMSLSYDHRVIDGADGARFLRFIAQALEDPFLIALG